MYQLPYHVIFKQFGEGSSFSKFFLYRCSLCSNCNCFSHNCNCTHVQKAVHHSLIQESMAGLYCLVIEYHMLMEVTIILDYHADNKRQSIQTCHWLMNKWMMNCFLDMCAVWVPTEAVAVQTQTAPLKEIFRKRWTFTDLLENYMIG